ncbi:MAG: NAD(P)H-hydrate epimerase [Planctomycetes bacterium]|nr:NAD(P)H-hydrate epimerase [Planctomycetota bacterium]
MLPPLTRSQVRAVDAIAIEHFGMPGVVLMENAGRGAAELLCRLGVNGRVVICAGKGNNGGDGYVIARHLELHDIATTTLLFCDPGELTGDAAINYHIIATAGLHRIALGPAPDPAELERQLAGADWIVDALLGTGTSGTLREPYLTAIAAINRAQKKVLAVDLPSGLDCDTGAPLEECVRARVTATFVARKIGFDAPGALQYTGQVQVIDIGAPRQLFARIPPAS